MALIASTRFDNNTLQQNLKYKEDHDVRGCIYGERIPIKSQVPLNTPLYVIEMNNSTNKIEGIGLIKNNFATDKYYKIYDKAGADFNRYVYKGDYRLTREELVVINDKLVDCVEQMCFKGKTHLKRLPGITIVSNKSLSLPVCNTINLNKEIRSIFLYKYQELI
jgi:hypothetical protein